MTREAELELEIARLREALEQVGHALDVKYYIGDFKALEVIGEIVTPALSTPPSTTTLQDLITEVERRTIERCAVACDLTHGGWHGDDSDVWLCMREIRKLPTGNLKLEDL